MVDGKVKGVKDFYAKKKATYTPTKSELKSPKAGQAWVDIFFAWKTWLAGHPKFVIVDQESASFMYYEFVWKILKIVIILQVEWLRRSFLVGKCEAGIGTLMGKM